MLKQKYVTFVGFLLVLLGLAFISVRPALALNPIPTNNGDTPTTASCTDGSQDPALCTRSCKDSQDCNITKRYINPFINKFLAPFAILAVIIGIIWGSIEYASSGGDPQRAASGKSKIQNALIGLLGFIFLYAFLQWLIPGGLI